MKIMRYHLKAAVFSKDVELLINNEQERRLKKVVVA